MKRNKRGQEIGTGISGGGGGVAYEYDQKEFSTRIHFSTRN